jgi:MFS transporter, MHS family, proline/betaine transporter
VLLGSAVGAAVTTFLDPNALASWGWRIPFLIGLGVGLAGLYIRRHLSAEPVVSATCNMIVSPVREAFRSEWRTMARLVALCAVGFYMWFVYITTYLRQIDHLAQSTALDINTISIAVLLLLVAPIGALSDRIGRKPVLLAATGGTVILAWPLFWMLHHSNFSVILMGRLVSPC